MSTISQTIYNTETHPGGSTIETRSGSKFKGDGFYNRADGLHTVQWNLTNFVGTVSVQATLAVAPNENDWVKVNLGKGNEYTIDTTGKLSTLSLTSFTYDSSTTGSFSYNFIGNYVWVRARIENWTSGTIDSILLSH
jgi:hypothetical protein